MALPLFFLLAGCPIQPIHCGAGTHLKGDECVADTDATDDTQNPDTTPVDTVDTVDTSNPDTGPDWEEPEDPGYPEFSENILTLSVAIRTADAEYAGTDDNTLSICVNADDCYTLNQADVDDFRRGEMDVYHFKAVGIPRADVDRIELKSVSGEDRWEPACIQVAFDGEHMYCNDTLNFYMGEESGERENWSDSTVPNLLCSTCDDDPLTHGPILGSTRAEDTRIWIRTDVTRRVVLYIANAGDPSSYRVHGYAYPLPGDDFTAEFQVTGLQPNTDYTYRLEIDGNLQDEVHDFRTAPADGDPVDMDLAFVSCSKDESQPGFASIDDGEPDLLLFVGDNHYGNTGQEGALHWYYRWAHSRSHRKQLMMDTSTLATWDDHDYVGNNTDADSPGKVNARLAFEDYWPNPAHGTEAVPGVFFSTSYGDVDLFFLDDRYYRGRDNSLTGADQMAWLMQELLNSSATFKLLVNGSQWTLEGSGDSWAAFPDARNEFFDFVREQAIAGVVLLSGDVHFSEFRTISHSGLYDLTEFTSSPIGHSTVSCGGNDSERIFCYDDDRSYVTLEIDTNRPDPRIWGNIHLEDGAVWGHHTIYYADLIP